MTGIKREAMFQMTNEALVKEAARFGIKIDPRYTKKKMVKVLFEAQQKEALGRTQAVKEPEVPKDTQNLGYNDEAPVVGVDVGEATGDHSATRVIDVGVKVERSENSAYIPSDIPGEDLILDTVRQSKASPMEVLCDLCARVDKLENEFEIQSLKISELAEDNRSLSSKLTGKIDTLTKKYGIEISTHGGKVSDLKYNK